MSNNVETERSFSFFLNFVRLFFTALVWPEFIALALYSCRRPGLALHTRMSGGIEGLTSQVKITVHKTRGRNTAPLMYFLPSASPTTQYSD